MTFDVQNADRVVQGEIYTPPPIKIEGLQVLPPVATPNSQAAGDDSTVLRALLKGGRVKLFDTVLDRIDEEFAVITTSGAQYDDGTGFALGYAVWFTAVAVQHKVNAAINIMFIPGAVALEANAVVPTVAEIEAAIGDHELYAILGDIRYHRSADTVIDTQVTGVRRPAYVDDSKKTGVTLDSEDATTMAKKFWGYVDLPVDLTDAFALGAGVLAFDGVPLPKLPLGGELGEFLAIPAVDGAGVGADMTFRLGLDGTPLTGNDLQLLLAASAVGQAPTAGAGAYASTPSFKSGATLDVEVEAAATAFTAGMAILRVEIWEYVG